MDETLQELENELKCLTPRRPSAAFRQTLERDLGPAAATAPVRQDDASANGLRSWKWVSWTMAAAAAIAFVAALQVSRQSATVPDQPPTEAVAVQPLKPTAPAVVAANRYEPVQATSVLYDLKEDGKAVLPDQTEGRQVRYRYVDTYTWKNPATNASLRWSVPRDEVRVIRASLD